MTADPAAPLLAGRYRVIRRLGTGGAATVLLAEDERLGRRVAVKRMHADSPGDSARRFEREARLGASLNHPNVVAVFDTATDDTGVLIVTEYVEGTTLAAALKQGPLSPERMLSVVDGLAGALDHAHRQGIVHRDVKPANVLMRPDGVVKLADLGIATATEAASITRTGAMLGTPAYMAPEQLTGGSITPATDVYGLAALAYEGLSGRPAWSGRTAMEVIHKVATRPPPDIRKIWRSAPLPVAEVLGRAMARDPSARPATAGALAAELRAALERGSNRGASPPPPTGTAASGSALGSLRAASALRAGPGDAAAGPAARAASLPTATDAAPTSTSPAAQAAPHPTAADAAPTATSPAATTASHPTAADAAPIATIPAARAASIPSPAEAAPTATSPAARAAALPTAAAVAPTALTGSGARAAQPPAAPAPAPAPAAGSVPAPGVGRDTAAPRVDAPPAPVTRASAVEGASPAAADRFVRFSSDGSSHAATPEPATPREPVARQERPPEASAPSAAPARRRVSRGTWAALGALALALAAALAVLSYGGGSSDPSSGQRGSSEQAGRDGASGSGADRSDQADKAGAGRQSAPDTAGGAEEADGGTAGKDRGSADAGAGGASGADQGARDGITDAGAGTADESGGGDTDGGAADSGSADPEAGPDGSTSDQGAAGGTKRSGPTESSSSGPAATPDAAVRGFYERAAADDFEEAWALAGPGFRQQLGGYGSFKGTLSTLQRVRFTRLETVEQGDAQVTLAIGTIATHPDRVERCTGTARAVRSAEGWQVDGAQIACRVQ